MASDVEGTLRCPTCGKGWPASHATCPDDGAPLTTMTGSLGVHGAETRILVSGKHPRDLSGARGASRKPSSSDAYGFDTVVDIAHRRGQEDEVPQFAPFDSDIRTYQAHRPSPDDPFARPAGAASSDPPTAFVRRPETHIELPAGSMVGDEYEIDLRLGAGAMGEVYAARHVKLGKRVAIKVMSPRLSEDTAAVERFAQEARTLAQMRHPGLVDVLGVGELADGRAYFVMEYLSGESLFDRLEHGRLDRNEAIDIFGQMARSLEAAHAHGVVHRDLKPENTFLARVTNEQRPIVKLLDFGLAKLAVDADRRTERTQSGVVIGTAMYLSPEQARGPDVDGRTDVYALGCIGYELFLGRHPFHEARTVAALIAAHMHEIPPIPRSIDPSIPAELDLMLFAMLAKDPSYRPSLAQVRSAIARVRSDATSAARATAAPFVRRPRPVRGWMGVLVAIALVVGIAIGARGFAGTVDRGAQQSIAARPADGITVTPIVSSGQRATPVPTAVVDAGGRVRMPDMDASPPTTRTPTPSSPRVKSRTNDAAVVEDASHSSIPSVDAMASPDIPKKLPASPPLISPVVTKPHVIPVEIPQRPVTPPPGRDDTINPFRKGPGSR